MRDSFKFPVGLGMIGAGLAISEVQKNKGSGINYSSCNNYLDTNYSKEKPFSPRVTVNKILEEMDFYSLCLDIYDFNLVKDRLNEYDFKSDFNQIQKKAKKYNRDDYFIPPYFVEMYKLLKKSYEKCIECWGYNPYDKKYADYMCLQDFVKLNRALKKEVYFHHKLSWQKISHWVFDECMYQDTPEQILDDMERKIVFANSLEAYYNEWREKREKYLNETQNKIKPLFNNEIEELNKENMGVSGKFIVPKEFIPECFENNPYYFTIMGEA